MDVDIPGIISEISKDKSYDRKHVVFGEDIGSVLHNLILRVWECVFAS